MIGECEAKLQNSQKDRQTDRGQDLSSSCGDEEKQVEWHSVLITVKNYILYIQLDEHSMINNTVYLHNKFSKIRIEN